MFQTRILFALAAALATAAAASAATLTTGSYVVAPGVASTTITVGITGGGAVASMDVLLIVGDGGPDAGGTTDQTKAPAFTGGTILTGIFSGNNTGDQFFSPIPGNTLLAANAAVTNTGTVNGDGTLATFTFSTVGKTPGVYALGFDASSTDVNGQAAELLGGTITILPEPTAALLLASALPLLRRRRTA